MGRQLTRDLLPTTPNNLLIQIYDRWEGLATKIRGSREDDDTTVLSPPDPPSEFPLAITISIPLRKHLQISAASGFC